MEQVVHSIIVIYHAKNEEQQQQAGQYLTEELAKRVEDFGRSHCYRLVGQDFCDTKVFQLGDAEYVYSVTACCRFRTFDNF